MFEVRMGVELLELRLPTKFHSPQLSLDVSILIKSVEYQFTFFPKLAPKRSWAVSALSCRDLVSPISFQLSLSPLGVSDDRFPNNKWRGAQEGRRAGIGELGASLTPKKIHDQSRFAQSELWIEVCKMVEWPNWLSILPSRAQGVLGILVH